MDPKRGHLRAQGLGQPKSVCGRPGVAGFDDFILTTLSDLEGLYLQLPGPDGSNKTTRWGRGPRRQELPPLWLGGSLWKVAGSRTCAELDGGGFTGAAAGIARSDFQTDPPAESAILPVR